MFQQVFFCIVLKKKIFFTMYMFIPKIFNMQRN